MTTRCPRLQCVLTDFRSPKVQADFHRFIYTHAYLHTYWKMYMYAFTHTSIFLSSNIILEINHVYFLLLSWSLEITSMLPVSSQLIDIFLMKQNLAYKLCACKTFSLFIRDLAEDSLMLGVMKSSPTQTINLGVITE